MDEQNKPKLSALALAKRSNDYATVAWTPEDVRQIRPAWDGPEARHFLEKHEAELAHIMLEIGRKVLAALIEAHEKEAADD
jgi:hypothetical protein